uniref:Uncharacterized protein n=1 Tax=Arundo donax TaxID=35708 RepID=A0A0A9A8X9_ARUDO
MVGARAPRTYRRLLPRCTSCSGRTTARQDLMQVGMFWRPKPMNLPSARVILQPGAIFSLTKSFTSELQQSTMQKSGMAAVHRAQGRGGGRERGQGRDGGGKERGQGQSCGEERRQGQSCGRERRRPPPTARAELRCPCWQ